MTLSAIMGNRSVLMILSTFESVLVPRRHSSTLRIKAKFSLAFIHALVLLLGSFLLLARGSVEKNAKRNRCIPCSFLQNMKIQVVWTIHVPLLGFAGYTPASFRFYFFYEQLENYGVNGIWLIDWKPFTSQKVVCPLIHKLLADTSALAWLLVFEDLGNFSPVNGVSKGSITTFLQTSPNISAVSFLSLLCLVITSPPFGQDKACCKLIESPQTHSVGKRSRGILYLTRIASQKACFSRKTNSLYLYHC